MLSSTSQIVRNETNLSPSTTWLDGGRGHVCCTGADDLHRDWSGRAAHYRELLLKQPGPTYEWADSIYWVLIKISEKQQAYRNTAGINRIAEERMLNQQGRKIVKEKRGNDIEETNHYFNIDAEEAPTFDANWERVNRENKFL